MKFNIWGSSYSLASKSKGRDNNLGLIKMVAAFAVIYSHCFALCLGPDAASYLSVFTAGHLSPGGIAVGLFFLFGGFYIAKSCESHPKAGDFFSLRLIRILPPLVLVVVLCVFIVGPCFTSIPVLDYFRESGTYAYLLNAVMILQHPLPGVFESNPYSSVINGPLWTLPVEFVCYILCYIFFRITRFDKKRAFVLSLPCAMAIVCWFVFAGDYQLSVVRAVVLFYIGVLLWIYREKIVINDVLGIASFVLFGILVAFKADLLAMLFPFVYAMLWLTYTDRLLPISRALSKYEVSYGVYLWGWPVQQMLISLWPAPMPPLENAVIASVIALCLGYPTEKGANAIAKKLFKK